jgi:hypothetical protein
MASTTSNSEKYSNSITRLNVLNKLAVFGKDFYLLFLLVISNAERLNLMNLLIVSQNCNFATSLLVTKALVLPVHFNFDSLDINVGRRSYDLGLNPVVSLSV